MGTWCFLRMGTHFLDLLVSVLSSVITHHSFKYNRLPPSWASLLSLASQDRKCYSPATSCPVTRFTDPNNVPYILQLLALQLIHC
ncbi:hypothetical protein QBC37DRAFT_122112 [Rhypophila decipiens]|uniref:Secreted protein n=1 Tax=Rhypophila decipiens TaxID=261697 RepID=A0AAN6YG99_9PEZI|nr:hypothetical protein QBC37DRAFT_122112 [Rhypophila decipiens]